MNNRRNTGKYPKYIKHRSIYPTRRICCLCGNQIHGYGYFLIYSPAPGKYLCNPCDLKRCATDPKEQEWRSKVATTTRQEKSEGPLYTPLVIESWASKNKDGE